MSFDFPSSPVQDQEYEPAGAGHVYIYKSPRWTIKQAPTSTGGDAPRDNRLYGRKMSAWSAFQTVPSITDPEFGAKGDGITDDTAAFILACSTPRAVYVPPGTYLLTDTVPVFGNIHCSGKGSTIFESQLRGNMNTFQFQTGSAMIGGATIYVSNHWFDPKPDGSFSGALAQGLARYGHDAIASRTGDVLIEDVHVHARGVNYLPKAKTIVDVSTTANITLTGEKTLDGYSTNNSRVLVQFQTNQKENGLWRSGPGVWVRLAGFETGEQLLAADVIEVLHGTKYSEFVFGSRYYICRNDTAPVVGTDNITFVYAYKNCHGLHVYGYSEDSTYRRIRCSGQMNYAIVAHWGGDIDSDTYTDSGLTSKSWHPFRLLWSDCVVENCFPKCTAFRLSATTDCEYLRCYSDGPYDAFEGFYGDMGGQFAQNVHPDDVMRGNRFTNCVTKNGIAFGFTYAANSNPGGVGQAIDYGTNHNTSVVMDGCQVIVNTEGATSWASGIKYPYGHRVLHGGVLYLAGLPSHISSAADEPGVGAGWDASWDLIGFPLFNINYIDDATIQNCRGTFTGAKNSDYAVSISVCGSLKLDKPHIENTNGINIAYTNSVTMIAQELRGTHDGISEDSTAGINTTSHGEQIQLESPVNIGDTVVYAVASTFTKFTHPGALLKSAAGSIECSGTVTLEDRYPPLYKWATATNYVKDIEATNRGRWFVCIFPTPHTSSAATEPGVGASSATYWREIIGQQYAVGSRVEHGPWFRCKMYHASTAETEPGVGANWTSFWDQVPQRLAIPVYPSTIALPDNALVDLCVGVHSITVTGGTIADFQRGVRTHSSFPASAATYGGSLPENIQLDGVLFLRNGINDLDFVYADGAIVDSCSFNFGARSIDPDTRSVNVGTGVVGFKLVNNRFDKTHYPKYCVYIPNNMREDMLLVGNDFSAHHPTTPNAAAIRLPPIADAGLWPLALNNTYNAEGVQTPVYPADTPQVYRQGGSLLGSVVAVPTTGTWEQGTLLRNRNMIAGGTPEWGCVQSGTFGALAGVTGSTTSALNTLTVNTVGSLLKGQFIAIAGVSGIKRIRKILGNVITLDSPTNTTVAGAAVSYSAPVFKAMPALGL